MQYFWYEFNTQNKKKSTQIQHNSKQPSQSQAVKKDQRGW
jgi:hypothetical protein